MIIGAYVSLFRVNHLKVPWAYFFLDDWVSSSGNRSQFHDRANTRKESVRGKKMTEVAAEVICNDYSEDCDKAPVVLDHYRWRLSVSPAEAAAAAAKDPATLLSLQAKKRKTKKKRRKTKAKNKDLNSEWTEVW